MAKTLPLKTTLTPGDLIAFRDGGGMSLWMLCDPLPDGTPTYGGVGREVTAGDEVTRVVWKKEGMIPTRTVRLEPGDVSCRSYSSRLVPFLDGEPERMLYENHLLTRL